MPRDTSAYYCSRCGFYHTRRGGCKRPTSLYKDSLFYLDKVQPKKKKKKKKKNELNSDVDNIQFDLQQSPVHQDCKNPSDDDLDFTPFSIENEADIDRNDWLKFAALILSTCKKYKLSRDAIEDMLKLHAIHTPELEGKSIGVIEQLLKESCAKKETVKRSLLI